MKTRLNDNLEQVQQELNRFQTKLIEYQQRIARDQWASHGCKESGALRRSALDLKQSLTLITQAKL